MDTSKEIIFANKIYGKTLLKKHPILTEMLCFVWLNLLFVSVCGEIANCSVMGILFVERVAGCRKGGSLIINRIFTFYGRIDVKRKKFENKHFT